MEFILGAVAVVVGLFLWGAIRGGIYKRKFDALSSALGIDTEPMILDWNVAKKFTPLEYAFSNAMMVRVRQRIANQRGGEKLDDLMNLAHGWVEKRQMRMEVLSAALQEAENRLKAHGLDLFPKWVREVVAAGEAYEKV